MLLAVILQNVRIGFRIMHNQLCDRDYWVNIEPVFANEQDVLEVVAGYHTMTLQYAIYQTIAITENCLSALARAGTGIFSVNPSVELKSLYSHVLSKLSLAQQYEELFDILRLVRNSQHSNGIFNPRHGKDEMRSYKGHVYHFREGQPVNWYTDDMITSLFEWLPNAMWEILTSTKVSNLVHIPLITRRV